MFEAHGWATIRVSPDAAADVEPPDCSKLRDEVASVCAAQNVAARLETDLNGAAVLTVTACKNHRHERVIGLFAWVAQHYPGSYGLLYVHDDEDVRGFDNDFRVWRLARGRLDEVGDPFLSPLIDTVEDRGKKDVD